jgi:hypothetical protein
MLMMLKQIANKIGADVSQDPDVNVCWSKRRDRTG